MLRKEHSLMVSERNVVSKIFGAKVMEVIRGWEKLPN
jgi:hypothetical protein